MWDAYEKTWKMRWGLQVTASKRENTSTQWPKRVLIKVSRVDCYQAQCIRHLNPSWHMSKSWFQSSKQGSSLATGELAVDEYIEHRKLIRQSVCVTKCAILLNEWIIVLVQFRYDIRFHERGGGGSSSVWNELSIHWPDCRTRPLTPKEKSLSIQSVIDCLSSRTSTSAAARPSIDANSAQANLITWKR